MNPKKNPTNIQAVCLFQVDKKNRSLEHKFSKTQKIKARQSLWFRKQIFLINKTDHKTQAEPIHFFFLTASLVVIRHVV